MFSSITGSPPISSVSDLVIVTPDECNGDDDDGDELSLGAMMSSLVGRSFHVLLRAQHTFIPSLVCSVLCVLQQAVKGSSRM
jgi:hypothetical protein